MIAAEREIDQWPPSPSREGFEKSWKTYQALKQARLEEVYAQEVAPLITRMLAGVRERRILGVVVDRWKETRLKAWRQPLDEPANGVAVALDDHYYEYSRSRAGDEIILQIENTWLLFHVLRSLHGVEMGQFEEINEAKKEEWIQALGPGFKSDGKLRDVNALREEAGLIETYNTQYRDFANTHRKALEPLSTGSSTPGTARRTVFNAVLAVGYDFKPERRGALMFLESKLGFPGAFVRLQRQALENLWISSAIKISAPREIHVFG